MPEAEPLVPGDPTVMGSYRLEGRLGVGGQGVVYLGRDDAGTPVAVKVLHAEPAADPRVRARFTKEIAAARRVDPFCIAQVLDTSMDGPHPYIVTEYIEGPSLQQAGRRDGAALQRLAVATATALAAIHEAGVVHRDFKPSNVLLGPDGPRVIDFGIARDTEASLTLTSGIIGTPAYMAPEQFAGEVAGPPADVFAWGAVIAFAATGRPPFGADTLPAIMRRILQGEADLGELPDPLRSTVAACLVQDPAQRPSMQSILLSLLGGRSAAPAPPPPPAMASPMPAGPVERRPSARRRPAVLLGVGAGAVALAVLAGAAAWAAWPDGAGASPGNGTKTGATGAAPQEHAGTSTGSGAAGEAPGSGSPSPSTDSSQGPRNTSSGEPDPGHGSGGGGSTAEPTEPSEPTARIAYFRVGGAADCYLKDDPFPFEYRIVGSKNPTKIQLSIYFDGQLGEGFPKRAIAKPDYTYSTTSQWGTSGTHTYRMVLQSPTHQEVTRKVRVC